MPSVQLSSLLAGLGAKDRAELKARALADLLNTGSYTRGNNTVDLTQFYTWTIDGVTVTFVRAYYEQDLVALALTVTAQDASGPLPVPARFYVRNPPILDGSGVEDIAGAAQQFIYDAVVTYARGHGWS